MPRTRVFKLVFNRIKRKINSQSRCGILPTPSPYSHGRPGNRHLLLASELSDPSPGGPGREMQVGEAALCVGAKGEGCLWES